MLTKNTILKVPIESNSSFWIILLAVAILFTSIKFTLVDPVVSSESALSLIEAVFEKAYVLLVELFNIEFACFAPLIKRPFKFCMLQRM